MRLKIKIHFTWLVMLLCVVLTNKTNAQLQPNFTQFLTDKGLQANTIYNLHIAKSGLLFIAHSKGLSSFDGSHFKNYYNKDYPFTELTNIMEDEDGKIFCKAFNNALYMLKADTVMWYANILPYSFGFAVSTIYKNELYSIANDSIVIFNTITKKRSNYALNKALKSVKSDFKFVGRSNNSAYGVTKEKNIYLLPNEINGNLHITNNDFFSVRNKQLSNINFYKGNELINIPTSQKNITINYISTTDSTIWICTTNGLFYRKKNDKGAAFNYLLNGYEVTDVKQTKEGNYFISTNGQGLLFIPNFKTNTIEDLPQKISYLSGNNTNLLLGTKDGNIIEYDVKNLKVTKRENAKSENAIKLLLHNEFDNTLFITRNNSVIGNLTLPFLIKDYCFINKNILLATNAGMYLYQNVQDNHWLNKYVITYQQGNSKLKKLSFSNEHTSTVKYDALHDKIYVNNYTGILEMEDGFADVKKMPEPGCVLKDMCVWEGSLLLASKDKGILMWDGIKYKPALTDMPTNGILYKFEIYKDELWVLGEEAIFCYKGNTLTKYDNQMGINADEIKGLYITNSTVYGNKGNTIVQFEKISGTNNYFTPTFLLNKVVNTNKQTSIKINETLGYKENSVTIQFSLIAFANATNTHIAYSINNKDLVHLPSNRREINLDFLKPDYYNIKFFIVSNGVVAKKESGSFSFNIKPPFYDTWWFYTLGIIAITFLIYYFVKRKIRKERAELALKESKILLEQELDKSTLTGIKAQMNPHFIFNALNTIQSYVYMNDKKNASIYISKFSDITRSILDMSTKEAITVSEEIKAIEIYLSLEKMRFEDSFNYEINIDNSIEKEKVEIPSMLLQPYLENAVKHGLLHRKTNRILKVDFTTENNYLKIIIDDNGIGRKKSEELKNINQKQHNSFAMGANKKRIEILKQQNKEVYLEIIDKYDTNKESLGTQIIIKLPLKN